MTLSALIIGSDSTIGKALENKLRHEKWHVFGTTRKIEQVKPDNFYLDLEKECTIQNINRDFDVIYVCAAITNMDFCERYAHLSKIVNLDSQIALAKHCINKTKSYIFLSTAAVFDGTSPMCTINTKANPKCNYGLHKMLTEQFLLNFSDKVTILRTTKVISKDNLLINSWISALNNNIMVTPFYDMTLSPVLIDTLVSLLIQIPKNKSNPIIHISGKSDILYSDLAHLIAARLHKPISLIKAKSYLHAGLKANTVFQYSSLDMSETTKSYGLQPLNIEDILSSILNDQD